MEDGNVEQVPRARENFCRRIFRSVCKCFGGMASSFLSFCRAFVELENHYLGNHVVNLYSTRHGEIDEDKKALEAANLPVLWISGGPGAPIQAFVDRLARMYNFHHVYMGEILTEEISLGTGKGEVAHQLMYRGTIVPRAFLIEIMKRDMVEAISIKDVKGFLFSDYPFTHEQAKNFIEKVSNVDFAVVLKFSELAMQLNAFQLLRAQSYSSPHLKRNKEQLRVAAENEVKEYWTNINAISKQLGKKTKVVDGQLDLKDAYREIMKVIEESLMNHDGPTIKNPPIKSSKEVV